MERTIICFRCKQEIRPNDNYFAMAEMNNGKEVKVDYVHKVCWNVFLNQLNGATTSLAKSNYLLNAMGNQMKKMGMLPDEEVEIKC